MTEHAAKYSNQGVTDLVTADFGTSGYGDSMRVPERCRVVHVTILDTLTSCTLTPQYSLDGGTTYADIDYDQEGRAYPIAGVTDASNPMTFVVPPGCMFRMKSSVDNDGNEWLARCSA